MITVEKAMQQLSMLVKMYRELRGLSQRDLSKAAGCAVGGISDIERCKRKQGINISTFIKIINVLKIPAKEIARAMREEVPELVVQRRRAECCGNCKYYTDDATCAILGGPADLGYTCIKFEED